MDVRTFERKRGRRSLTPRCGRRRRGKRREKGVETVEREKEIDLNLRGGRGKTTAAAAADEMHNES